jgi:hypothetical protein
LGKNWLQIRADGNAVLNALLVTAFSNSLGLNGSSGAVNGLSVFGPKGAESGQRLMQRCIYLAPATARIMTQNHIVETSLCRHHSD